VKIVQLGHCNIQLMGIVLHSWWDCRSMFDDAAGGNGTADRNDAASGRAQMKQWYS
jgi:hypothetical protein